jgi:imidazolonepropionase-like amidohydrolase
MNAVADGPDAVRREVRTLVHEGADFIKIMASGGGTAGTLPGCASYTVEELRAAVEEAHSFGKLTAAHTRAKAGMVNAVLARVDLLEHAQFLDQDMVPRFDPKVAEKLLETGAFVGPTLQACTRHGAMIRLLEKEKCGRLSDQEKRRKSEYQERREMFLGLLGKLLNAGFGGRIVAGSDSGCGEITFGHLVYDLELMVAAGMTNMAALQAATSVAARAIGLGDLLGSLESGKEADLLVVNGDPLISIADLNRVVAVIKGGVRVV